MTGFAGVSTKFFEPAFLKQSILAVLSRTDGWHLTTLGTKFSQSISLAGTLGLGPIDKAISIWF